MDAALISAWLAYVQATPATGADAGLAPLERARADRAARQDAGLSLDDVLRVEAAIAAFVSSTQLDALLASAELQALERTTGDGGQAADGGSKALARVAKALAALRVDGGSSRRDALVARLGLPAVEALEAEAAHVTAAWQALGQAR